jgi:hypothetical protein
MLQVAEVKELPRALDLTEWAEVEYNSVSGEERAQLLQLSAHIWTLSLNGEVVMVVGVYTQALVGPAELWMLLCRGFGRKLRHNLEAVKELVGDLLDLYPGVRVRIDSKFPAGHKFATFMGFVPVSTVVKRDREYGLYEVK